MTNLASGNLSFEHNDLDRAIESPFLISLLARGQLSNRRTKPSLVLLLKDLAKLNFRSVSRKATPWMRSLLN